MPPTIGAAIGFMASEPMPLSHKIGIKLASTAVTVMSLGRKHCTAPAIAAVSMSSCRSGTPEAILLSSANDTRLDSDSKERNIAYPHGNAKVNLCSGGDHDELQLL